MMDIEAGTGVDVQKYLGDTLRSCIVESPIPEVARLQECCMGIDEAGRGPVLG
jgi:ribonuclease H2 subunit A